MDFILTMGSSPQTSTEELWNLHRGALEPPHRSCGTFKKELWNLHRSTLEPSQGSSGTEVLRLTQTELLAAELHVNYILSALHVLRAYSNESVCVNYKGGEEEHSTKIKESQDSALTLCFAHRCHITMRPCIAIDLFAD